jgi:O-antigen/teichoic acid export membrane protein
VRINNILKTIKAQLNSSLAKDSFWMFLSQGISFSMLMAYFLIIARVLSADGYGAFAGIAALAAIIGPFAGWGTEHILIKNVSRDESTLSVSWGNSLLVTLVSGIFLTLAALPVGTHLFAGKVSTIAVLAIFVADLQGIKLANLAGSVLAALRLFRMSAAVRVLLTAAKVGAAVVFASFFRSTGIQGWAIIYCLSSVLPSLIMVAFITHRYARPTISLPVLIADIKEGFYFSINASSETINASLDKTMMVSLSSLSAAGLYSAAYRFVDFGYFPMFSLQSATYPRFFKYGESGIGGSWGFAKKLMPIAFGYGGLSALLMTTVGPILIPLVLGPTYKDAVAILPWLAPIHLLIFTQYLIADSLTCAGFQGVKSAVILASAGLNFGLNYLLIPTYSWRGAAGATLTTEVLKLIALYLLVVFFLRKSHKVEAS